MSHSNNTPTQHENMPLFSFGLVADVQYADADPRQNFEKTHWRYYRAALQGLRRAVTYWKQETQHAVSFVIQLGDLIDGLNAENKQSEVALKRTLAEFDDFPGKVHHTCGNHELYNFNKVDFLRGELNSAPREGHNSDNTCSYYSFHPHPKFCFIMLDTFECTVLGRPHDDPVYIKSLALLRKYNPNDDLNSPEGLEGGKSRFTAFNGGVSDTQLRWLDETLKKAEEDGQYVVIAGHHPIFTSLICLSWNYEEILATIYKYKCVIAYFAGHDHEGGYGRDERGIHHITFHGLIEAQPGTADFGTVHVYADRMQLEGNGRIPSRIIDLPPQTSMQTGMTNGFGPCNSAEL